MGRRGASRSGPGVHPGKGRPTPAGSCLEDSLNERTQPPLACGRPRFRQRFWAGQGPGDSLLHLLFPFSLLGCGSIQESRAAGSQRQGPAGGLGQQPCQGVSGI